MLQSVSSRVAIPVVGLAALLVVSAGLLAGCGLTGVAGEGPTTAEARPWGYRGGYGGYYRPYYGGYNYGYRPYYGGYYSYPRSYNYYRGYGYPGYYGGSYYGYPRYSYGYPGYGYGGWRGGVYVY